MGGAGGDGIKPDGGNKGAGGLIDQVGPPAGAEAGGPVRGLAAGGAGLDGGGARAGGRRGGGGAQAGRPPDRGSPAGTPPHSPALSTKSLRGQCGWHRLICCGQLCPARRDKLALKRMRRARPSWRPPLRWLPAVKPLMSAMCQLSTGGGCRGAHMSVKLGNPVPHEGGTGPARNDGAWLLEGEGLNKRAVMHAEHRAIQ